MLSTVASIPALGWLVFVELPMQRRCSRSTRRCSRPRLLLVLGLALAALGAWVLARRMMGPIRALGGAARLGGGDLGHRIDVRTGDEIETLARQLQQHGRAAAGVLRRPRAEGRDRTHELARSVEELTASGEVLRLIAGSPDDLQPMFQSILEHATRLCEARFGTFWMFEGDAGRAVAMRGAPPAYEAYRMNPGVVGADRDGPVRGVTGAGQIEDVRATPATPRAIPCAAPESISAASARC